MLEGAAAPQGGRRQALLLHSAKLSKKFWLVHAAAPVWLRRVLGGISMCSYLPFSMTMCFPRPPKVPKGLLKSYVPTLFFPPMKQRGAGAVVGKPKDKCILLTTKFIKQWSGWTVLA